SSRGVRAPEPPIRACEALCKVPSRGRFGCDVPCADSALCMSATCVSGLRWRQGNHGCRIRIGACYSSGGQTAARSDMSLLDRRLPLLASPSSRLRVLLSAAIRCLFVGITLVPRPRRAEPLEWSRWPMPAPRRSNVAGYDQVGNRLLIYGGFGTGQDGFNGETWALTLGAAPGWSLVHEFGFGTAQCLFAQDATANREFVLGGQNNGIPRQGMSDLAPATGAWTAHSPTGPAPTLVTYDSPATVYDSSRNHLVLLGGQSMGSDSYSFDPATSVWSTSAGTGTVPTVVGKFAAYDPVR